MKIMGPATFFRQDDQSIFFGDLTSYIPQTAAALPHNYVGANSLDILSM